MAAGWPIATGIIEAILKLRALTSNGDFNDYWTYHLTREHHRTHQTRYANSVIPQAA